jgi:hypothetical protein
MSSRSRIFRAVVASVLLLTFAFGTVVADRGLRQVNSRRAPLRAYNGATPQQYDTLAVSSGERVELMHFTTYADDSAQASGILTIWFTGLSSGTTYLKLNGPAFTANEIRTTVWDGPFVFPTGESILVYYNITGATPATIDTLIAQSTYKLERP